MKPNIAEWTAEEIALEARRMYPEDSDHELRARYIKTLMHQRNGAIATARQRPPDLPPSNPICSCYKLACMYLSEHPEISTQALADELALEIHGLINRYIRNEKDAAP